MEHKCEEYKKIHVTNYVFYHFASMIYECIICKNRKVISIGNNENEGIIKEPNYEEFKNMLEKIRC